MDNDYKEIQETFISESTELLEKMENSLYHLETEPENSDSINAVFRAIHTIKGTAGMFGFNNIVHFTHDVENLLDQVRDGKITLIRDLIKILLETRDHTQELIEIDVNGEEPSAAVKAKTAEILGKLTPYFSGSQPKAATVAVTPEIETASPVSQNVSHPYWHITLRPGSNTFQNALDPLSFIQYLNKFGKILNIVTLTGEIPAKSFNPEVCYLTFEITLESDADQQTIRKSFDFLEYDSFIRVIPPGASVNEYAELFKTTVISQEIYSNLFRTANILTEEELNLIQTGLKEPAIEVKEAAVQEKKPEPATASIQTPTPPSIDTAEELILATAKAVDEAQAGSAPGTTGDKSSQQRESKTLRVDSERVNQLINLVGELVISGANISQQATMETENHRLQESSQLLLRLIGEIREHTLKLRMVPIGETFQKFSRIVREVGRDLNKDVKLQVYGGETELDKTVVEKINDPLVHIIRNAIDHGLETEAERITAGKPPGGTLKLSAFHDTGNIVIKIEDDGRGLNKAKILEKAIAKGHLSHGQSYTDNEIYQTIFLPGLSTAEKITNISGRGVGLDVVQRNIDALRGSITIQSKEGQGTTFIIRLPLTLAIIDGFMVGVADSLYIIPLDMILECVDMDSSVENQTINHSDKSNFINMRGEVLPILKISEIFNEKNRKKGRESIVIVQYGEKKAGLVVDKLYGEIQTVIKPLGKLFDTTKLLSGATILGNGDVAMILDVGTLITQFIQEEIREKSINI